MEVPHRSPPNWLMPRVRAFVVDDEPLAREGMEELLERHPSIEVVGSFADGPSALRAFEELTPDALFVDVQMPGMTGFELVEAIETDPLPAIVFVTAYDEFAIRAFDVMAIDYLLKPVAAERLAQAVQRVEAHVRAAPDAAYRTKIASLLEHALPDRARGVGRLIVREVGQIIVVPTRDVDWIEGADYYAKLHVGPKVHMLRETLGSLEKRLDPTRFLRIHRSVIVNLTRVKSVEAHVRGEAIAVLGGGVRLKVSRGMREELERRLEGCIDSVAVRLSATWWASVFASGDRDGPWSRRFRSGTEPCLPFRLHLRPGPVKRALECVGAITPDDTKAFPAVLLEQILHQTA
jgi:two-component system, LytTR family, response regulator